MLATVTCAIFLSCSWLMPAEVAYYRAYRFIKGAMPALALTGLAGEEARLRSLAAGYQEHLTKPLAMEELVTTIARLASSNS